MVLIIIVVAFSVLKYINREKGEFIKYKTKDDYNNRLIEVNGTSGLNFMFAVALTKDHVNVDDKYFDFHLVRWGKA